MRSHRNTSGCGSFVAILVGLLLLTIGATANFVAPTWINRENVRLAALPRLTAATLGIAGVAVEASLEGVIDPTQARQYRDFVAFVREQASMGRDPAGQWVEVGRVTPPLQVLTSSGAVVHVFNNNYDIRNPITTFTDSVLVTNGTTRYRGFEVGHRVLVVGRTAREGGAMGLDADFVAAGTMEDYTRGQSDSLFIARVIGGILALAGTLMIVVAAIAMRR